MFVCQCVCLCVCGLHVFPSPLCPPVVTGVSVARRGRDGQLCDGHRHQENIAEDAERV